MTCKVSVPVQKNDLNTRKPYLSYRAKILHDRESESENDAKPDLRQKIAPGSGQAVLDAIISLTPRNISFPNTQQKQQETKQGFYQINGFPHVLGAIDCSHVRIVPPAATEHLYRNRKHTHSINVQAIVDHRGLITNIVAKYPGSVHDSFIFRRGTINQHFQDGRYGNGLLVVMLGRPGLGRMGEEELGGIHLAAVPLPPIDDRSRWQGDTGVSHRGEEAPVVKGLVPSATRLQHTAQRSPTKAPLG
ncbi:hypothetical protein NDU88_005224 [Pleurodeles waltl]|uniref:DDE Tnp4 domain-containing protein n=1 Tax=Pleurodeles waltl TaxID=8319 RepID=A0AAV7WXN2_PLEWA|nr:hypothetical protein NDU88_005224 [Pleurodeles waltl]